MINSFKKLTIFLCVGTMLSTPLSVSADTEWHVYIDGENSGSGSSTEVTNASAGGGSGQTYVEPTPVPESTQRAWSGKSDLNRIFNNIRNQIRNQDQFKNGGIINNTGAVNYGTGMLTSDDIMDLAKDAQSMMEGYGEDYLEETGLDDFYDMVTDITGQEPSFPEDVADYGYANAYSNDAFYHPGASGTYGRAAKDIVPDDAIVVPLEEGEEPPEGVEVVITDDGYGYVDENSVIDAAAANELFQEFLDAQGLAANWINGQNGTLSLGDDAYVNMLQTGGSDTDTSLMSGFMIDTKGLSTFYDPSGISGHVNMSGLTKYDADIFKNGIYGADSYLTMLQKILSYFNTLTSGGMASRGNQFNNSMGLQVVYFEEYQQTAISEIHAENVTWSDKRKWKVYELDETGKVKSKIVEQQTNNDDHSFLYGYDKPGKYRVTAERWGEYDEYRDISYEKHCYMIIPALNMMVLDEKSTMGPKREFVRHTEGWLGMGDVFNTTVNDVDKYNEEKDESGYHTQRRD